MSQQKAWQRLDIRSAWIDLALLVLCIGGIGWYGWYFVFGGSLRWALIGVALVIADFMCFVIADLIRCITTRFYISDERVELRYGLVWKVRRSIPQDRIRSVDVSSNPMYRILRLAKVKLGTGQHAGNVEQGELVLDALSSKHAEELQQQLLRRSKSRTKSDETVLAVFQRRGMVYALFGFSGLALIGAFSAGLMQVLEWINADFAAIWREVTRVMAQYFGSAFWMTIVAIIGGYIIVGSILSVLLYLENWSGYRLTRTSNRTLRLVRGLLFRKSLTIEERRIRGVEYSEPLQIRWLRGAVLRVIVSGFGQKKDDISQETSIIMPTAPYTSIDRVTSQLLNERSLKLADLTLHKHPKAAFRRIIFRRVLVSAAIIGVLLIVTHYVPWLAWLWIPTIFLCLAIILMGFDAYRNLGHAIHSRYLVVRSGSLLRRTAVLQRSGIIGWNFRQSPLQRRLNLMTVTATTAAGREAYKITDVGSEEGIVLAQAAVPRLLDPYVEGKQQG